MDCIWGRWWINFLLGKQFRSDMLQGGLECALISSWAVNWQWARHAELCHVKQHVEHMPFEKKIFFMHDLMFFFKRVYLVYYPRNLVLQSFIEKLMCGWYFLKFLIRILQFERIWHLVFQVSLWIAYFYWTFSYF